VLKPAYGVVPMSDPNEPSVGERHTMVGAGESNVLGWNIPDAGDTAGVVPGDRSVRVILSRLHFVSGTYLASTALSVWGGKRTLRRRSGERSSTDGDTFGGALALIGGVGGGLWQLGVTIGEMSDAG
jgi:hypothetical protein